MDKQLGKVPEVILVQLEIKLLAVGFPLHQAVDPSKHSQHCPDMSTGRSQQLDTCICNTQLNERCISTKVPNLAQDI